MIQLKEGEDYFTVQVGDRPQTHISAMGITRILLQSENVNSFDRGHSNGMFFARVIFRDGFTKLISYTDDKMRELLKKKREEPAGEYFVELGKIHTIRAVWGDKDIRERINTDNFKF